MSEGEIRELIYGTDGQTFVLGDQLAYQGKEGCRNVTCTRLNGRCVGWHCPRCHEPCDSQGGHPCLSDVSGQEPR